MGPNFGPKLALERTLNLHKIWKTYWPSGKQRNSASGQVPSCVQRLDNHDQKVKD